MKKFSFFLVRICVVGLLLESGRRAAGSVDPWGDVKPLTFLDGEDFRRVVNPLVEMSANAYRYPGIIPIRGWTLVDGVAPIHGGMHALVYEDVFDSGRMVVAIRGTDITGSESGRADVCADNILWDEDPVFFDPIDCSEFNSDTLDYYKQAVDYTRKMLEAHPQASFLLTGHSLGAGLAILVTATFGSTPLLPVVAFRWDEIMRLSWERQIGTLCLYETTITEDCTACFEDEKFASSTGSCEDFSTGSGFAPRVPGIIQDSTLKVEENTDEHPETEVNPDVFTTGSRAEDCLRCFYETHYLQHVIDLVELGNKPVCESQGIGNIQTVSSIKGYPISDL